MGLGATTDILKLVKFLPDSVKTGKLIAKSLGMQGANKMISKMAPESGAGARFAKAVIDKDMTHALYKGRWDLDAIPIFSEHSPNAGFVDDLISLQQKQLTRITPAGEETITGDAVRGYLEGKWKSKPVTDGTRTELNAWAEMQAKQRDLETLNNKIYQTGASEHNMPIEYQDNYWPRRWPAELMAGADASRHWENYLRGLAEQRGFYVNGEPDLLQAKKFFDQELAPRKHFIADNLWYPRVSNAAGYDKSGFAYLGYIDESAQMMAEWKHLGPDYSYVHEWLDLIEKESGSKARDFAQWYFDWNFNRGMPSKFMSDVNKNFMAPARNLASTRLNYFTGFRNLFQAQFAMYATGVKQFVKSIGALANPATREAFNQFAKESRLFGTQVPKEWSKEWPGRIYHGSSSDFWAGEMGVTDRLGSFAQWWLKYGAGMTASERYTRSIAGWAGREDAVMAFAKAAKGDKKALSHLRELVDTGQEEPLSQRLLQSGNTDLNKMVDSNDASKANLAYTAMQRAAWRVVDETQFGLSGRKKLPLFWHGDVGKFLFQFRSFSHLSMQFFWNTFQKAWKQGDIEKVVSTFLPALGATYIGGKGAIQPLMHWMYQIERDEDPVPWMSEKESKTSAYIWHNVIEPFVVMGVADLFFDIAGDVIGQGKVNETVRRLFLDPVGVEPAVTAGRVAEAGIKGLQATREWGKPKLMEGVTPGLQKRVARQTVPLFGSTLIKHLINKRAKDEAEYRRTIKKFFPEFYQPKPVSPRRRQWKRRKATKK